jgi:voltage-gated potassium channel
MLHITEKDRERILVALSTVAALVAIGTLTMRYAEGWSWVDSFYFTTMTVTTVGHGELYPTSDASKIIQSLLAFAGVMMVVYSMSVVGRIYFRQAESFPVTKEITAKMHNVGRGKRKKGGIFPF